MYTSIELFAWCWWLALWLERAWFKHLFLNDFDKYAVKSLKTNRSDWDVSWEDINDINFSKYKWKVDLLSWWFPCQSFSYAWKQLWFKDARGVLFLQYARAISEIQPKIFLAENVKWLLTHNEWKTLCKIKEVFSDLWYTIFEPRVLEAIKYQVPQKRQRIFIIWVRNDLYKGWIFQRPKPCDKIYTLKDALKKWELFDKDVPISVWQLYPKRKKEILEMIPPGWYWRDLPIELQKEYMQKSFYLWWGKTWMARRISWDEPSLTLTCSPAQKQTERCHPDETRPFSVREYARIQTFPDEWVFEWPVSQQYKQIWNAVPVNLAYHVWTSIVDMLDNIALGKDNLDFKNTTYEHKKLQFEFH